MTRSLTPEQEAALTELLPAEQRTGDLVQDLAAAVRVSMQIRRDNTRRGAAVIDALHDRVSWRELERLTDVPFATARRWAERTPGT